MLKNTFIHLPHIGRVTEERLWRKNITTWRDILYEKNEYSKKFRHIKHLLKMSELKLRLRDVRFFTAHLRPDQHWRLFSEFQNETAYLDIETTGLGTPTDYITSISVYDGRNICCYVHGKNMEQFKKDIRKYKVIITYNGKCFDVPFIEHEFGIHLTQAHLDLRYILRSLGISGGLKSCEHQLGLARGDLEGIDGYFAVLLWREYLAGNKKALDTLLAYNIEDTVNLEKLMRFAFDKKLAGLPINKAVITPSPAALHTNQPQTKSPYHPDMATIDKIKEKYY